jgi:WD40 repeat protein
MSGTGSGGEFIAGWAIIGVIVAYFPPGSACEGPPAKKGKRDLSDGAFSTPLGEEDQGQLGLGATTGLWRVVFGDGSEQMMDEAAVHAAVFRFRSLISSAAAQIKSLVTPEMLDLKLIPPYFAQFSEAGDVDAAVMCPFCQGAVHEEAGENEDLSVVACAVCTKRAHASCCGVPPGPDGRILVWVCERCMEIQNRFYYCAKCLKELKSVTAYKYHRKINVCNKKMLVAVEKMNRMKERRPIVRRRQRVSKAGEPQEEASGQFSFIYEDDRTSSVVQEAREEAVGGAEAERAAIEEEKVASETFIPSKSFVDFAVMENYLEPLWHFHPNSAPYITISQWASAFLSSSFDQRDKSRLNSLWSLVLVDVGPSLPPNETESFDTLNAAARSRRVTDSLSSAPALRAFESCTLHSDDESVYLNTGGAVTSISFAPFQPLGRESNTSDKIQYFAVAMGSIGFHSERTPEPPGGRHHDYNSAQFGPGYLEPLVLGQCRRVDNILQLWSSKNIGSGRSDERFATLEYAVELRARGAVLQTAWSPFKCHGTARFDDVQASFPIKWRSYLGTLALVCGDGLCLVFMLPSKHHGNVLASTGWGAGPEAPVLPENSVCRFILGTGEAHDHILCADWSRSNPFQLFCGHRDGAISVWNLDSIAALRIKNPAIWLTDALTPRTSVIRAVRACPYNSDWVAAGGQDGKVRVS